MTNIPKVSFAPDLSPVKTFWGKPDLLPNGDRRSCFHSHMGLWSMEPTSLKTRAGMVVAGLHGELDPTESLKAEFYSTSSFPRVMGNLDSMGSPEKFVAVIPVHGAITKKKSKFAETSALEIRRMVRQMAADDSVSKIVLHIDSPGGAVSGISDLASEIKQAAKAKPVVAFIEDMGASAAYWIASQCTEVVANEGALVGSLGTYGLIHDVSGAYERRGVKVHLISSGGAKGKGAGGTVIDKEVLADQQRVVDTINALFKADVARGRNFSQKKIDGLFDGRVHGASEALAIGLIDRVGSFDSVLAKEDDMEDKPKKPDPKEDDSEEEEEDEKKSEFPPKKDEGDEEEDEDEEEDMPKKDKKAESFIESDIEALANEVKAAGCPFSLESIKSKLAGSVKDETDEIEASAKLVRAASKLSSIKKFAGEHASPESPEAKSVPVSYEAMVSDYRAKMKEAKTNGIPVEKLTSYMGKAHPDLVEAMTKEATKRTNAIRASK